MGYLSASLILPPSASHPCCCSGSVGRKGSCQPESKPHMDLQSAIPKGLHPRKANISSDSDVEILRYQMFDRTWGSFNCFLPFVRFLMRFVNLHFLVAVGVKDEQVNLSSELMTKVIRIPHRSAQTSNLYRSYLK